MESGTVIPAGKKGVEGDSPANTDKILYESVTHAWAFVGKNGEKTGRKFFNKYYA